MPDETAVPSGHWLTRPRRAAVGLLVLAGFMELLGRLVDAPLLSVLASAALGVLAADAGLVPSLQGLRVRRAGRARMTVGVESVVRLQVAVPPRRRLRTPLLLTTRHPALGERVDVTATLGRTGSVQVEQRVTPERRGHWSGHTEVEVVTLSPFGAFRRRRTLRLHHPLWVHPPAALPLPIDHAVTAVGGASLQHRRRHDGEDLVGLREWAVGDSVRTVHWRASARRNSLVVAERERPQAGDLLVAAGSLDGSPPAEQLLARVAATCLTTLRSGRRVHLLTGDRQVGVAAASACLDWFAELDSAPSPTAAAVRRTLNTGAGVATVLWLADSVPGADVQATVRLAGARLVVATP